MTTRRGPCSRPVTRGSPTPASGSTRSRPSRGKGGDARHNLNYWRFGDYLGVGAGAHGKLSHALPGDILRTRQPREPRRYVAHAGSAPDIEAVAAERIPFEFALNAFRLRDGFDAALYTAHTGQPFDGLSPTLAHAQARGLVEENLPGHWRPTELGNRFLNDLIAEFLPEG